MATTDVLLIVGLFALSVIPSDAVTCYECQWGQRGQEGQKGQKGQEGQRADDRTTLHLQTSNCLDSSATSTCDGPFCQSVFYASDGQSVPTIYRSCIELSTGFTVEHCTEYSQVDGVKFYLIENQCCYSSTNATGTYTHCFCQDDYCNSNALQPGVTLGGRPLTTTMASPIFVQPEVVAQSPADDGDLEQQQVVTCYDCKYLVNGGVVLDSTCSEPFNSTGVATCSSKACYTYASVEEEQYIVIRGCDSQGNFDFQSDEQCLQYSKFYNGTFFVFENQCCYTITGRWSVQTVCHCHSSDLCNTKVSRPVLVLDPLTTTSKTPMTTSADLPTFPSTITRNDAITQADPVLATSRPKRFTPSVSLKTSLTPTKRPITPIERSPSMSNIPRVTTAKTSVNNTTTTARVVSIPSSSSMSSIACYNCSYFPDSESADDSICRSPTGPTAIETCSGKACYIYAYTSDKGISVIDRKCDKQGTVVFQSDEQCLQYSRVYNLTFFIFEHQCCYKTDESGMPVTVCFCNTELCNSNRFRPMPQTATTASAASISNPLPDILPSSRYDSGSNVHTTRETTLNTSLGIPSTSGRILTSRGADAGSMQPTATTSSTSPAVTPSTSAIDRTRTTTQNTSSSSSLLSSTQILSDATVQRQVRCYDCTYFPSTDSTGTSLCNGAAGSTDSQTCFGRSCYTYSYVSDRGVVVIYRACDIEGTLEFESDEQCLRYSQIHHLTFFTYERQCCYITVSNGLPVTVCFCNNDLCNSNRSRPTKKR